MQQRHKARGMAGTSWACGSRAQPRAHLARVRPQCHVHEYLPVKRWSDSEKGELKPAGYYKAERDKRFLRYVALHKVKTRVTRYA